MTELDPTALRSAVAPIAEVVGWATVELDRAEGELTSDQPAVVEARPRDAQLGAAARLLTFPDGRRVLLLEPDTEGRLAASLARFGEGAAVLYLVADGAADDAVRNAGFVLSAASDGPLGHQRLVVGGPAWGPHLVVVLAEAPPPATIRP
jgi:hypothetical protein